MGQIPGCHGHGRRRKFWQFFACSMAEKQFGNRITFEDKIKYVKYSLTLPMNYVLTFLIFSSIFFALEYKIFEISSSV